MGHHDCADHARCHPPTRCPTELLFSLPILKLDSAGFGKVLAKEMRGASLDRFPVLGHRFDRRRLDSARKFFALGFFAGKNRDGAIIAHKSFIDAEHAKRFFARFPLGLVHGVPFLPQEFRSAQEQSGPHFPAHNIGPLIDQDRQVAIRLHPLRVGCANDCLRRRPNNQWLVQRTGWFHFSFGVDFEP